MSKLVVDLDDLYDEHGLAVLSKLHKRHPLLRATVYTVPNRFGAISSALREQFPWVCFGIHGWEHTHYECEDWTEAKAEALIVKALTMGYDPVFKAPNWIVDGEVAAACAHRGVILHCRTLEQAKGFGEVIPDLSYYAPLIGKEVIPLHTHLVPNPATDSVESHPGFQPLMLEETLKAVSEVSWITELPL